MKPVIIKHSRTVKLNLIELTRELYSKRSMFLENRKCRGNCATTGQQHVKKDKNIGSSNKKSQCCCAENTHKIKKCAAVMR